MKKLCIRKMKIKDLDKVLEIEKLCFPTPWSRTSFLGELRDNKFAYYIVAEKDDELIGYGGMWVIINEAHVTNVAVKPGWRGKGVGKFIMLELMKRAKLMGCNSMTLEVRTSNIVAQKLYAKLGFKLRGIRKGYYIDTGEDAYIMWKEKL